MSPLTGFANDEFLRGARHSLIDAALEGHRIYAGGNRLHAFLEIDCAELSRS
jgi:hypothetical protein